MAQKKDQSQILNDLPTGQDALDFKPYIETLIDIVESDNTSTPLTIGVFGSWGSGKTSLMKMVKEGLPKTVRSTWFNAWKYDKQKDLWRVLLLRVLQAVLETVSDEASEKETKKDKEAREAAIKELEDLQTALYKTVDREEMGGLTFDGQKLGKGLAQGAVQVGLSFIPGGDLFKELVTGMQAGATEGAAENLLQAIKRERSKIHIDQVEFLEQFHSRFSDVVEIHLVQKKKRLVVFIDDLDRCLPEKAVEVLEAIKLFLDVPGCIFMLGVDPEVIARGIEIKYRELDLPEDTDGRIDFTIEGLRYLEKIIQLPFQIPPIEQEDMSGFVSGLVADWPDASCPQVFAEGLGENPRQVKRTVNVFLLLWSLAKRREEKLQGLIKPVRLAKVVAIQHISQELYNLLKRTPRFLRELEDYYRKEAGISGERGLEGEGETPVEQQNLPPGLAHIFPRIPEAVRRVLTMHEEDAIDANFIGLSPSELRLYFTLTRRAEAPLPASSEQPREVFEPQLVRIPAGKFRMGSTDEDVQDQIKERAGEDWANRQLPQHSIELPEYHIGKYPVTNAEYDVFVQDTGHDRPRGWSEGNPPEDKTDHPVVRVSWHDANAYSQWLSEKTNKAYRLPTEAEWEYAARGDDARIYPWGNQMDNHLDILMVIEKCNVSELGIDDTTPVGQYSPAGDSVYGCADMAGNVWEWCGSLLQAYPYDPSDGREEMAAEDSRVLRGGSFNDNQRNARCASRNFSDPGHRNFKFGFRVMLSPFLNL